MLANLSPRRNQWHNPAVNRTCAKNRAGRLPSTLGAQTILVESILIEGHL
jgi:hypothetical protein